MNKIYKVIWNKTLNCWNVTSELGKAHGKAAAQVSQSAVESNPFSDFFFSLKVSAIAIAMALFSANAAAYESWGSGRTGATNIVMGGGSTTRANAVGDNSTIIGASAKGIGAIDGRAEGATAIGSGAEATGGATALGWNAKVSGTTGGVALGADTRVSGSNAMAMGWAASASGDRGIAIGTSSGGTNATASQANSADSIAIGTGAVAETAVSNTTNQGANISIGKDAYSSNYGAAAQIIANRNGSGGDMTFRGPDGVGTTTRIQPSSVSIGEYSEAYSGSTAVGYNNIAGTNSANGMSAFAFGNSNEATSPFSMAMGLGNKSTGGSSVALGTANTASGDTSIAIGRQVTASGNYSTALGNVASATGNNAFAVGHSSEASGLRSIAIGSTLSPNNSYSTGTEAKGTDAIALGTQAVAVQKESIAIGKDVRADGQQSIAIGSTKSDGGGQNTQAYTSNAIAIGVGAIAGINGASASSNSQNTAVGYNAKATGHQSTAIGSDTLSSGNFATALGIGSEATAMGASAVGGGQASAQDAVAIGGYSQATVNDSIALGSSSVANRAAGQAGFNTVTNASSTNTNSTWKATTAALSIGSNTTTRQITGVAAGSADTDAVNVAQLKNAQTHYYSVNSAIAAAGSNYNNDGATGVNALAAGVSASATQKDAVAVGANAKGTGESSVAIGAAQANSAHAIAIGTYSNVSGQNSVAVGVQNTVAQANTVAVGSNITTSQANSVVLGNASTDRAATAEPSATVGGVTYNGFAGQGKAANGVVSVGAAGKERQIINVAAGQISAGSTDAINGSQLYAVASKPITFAGDSGTNINRKLGETLNIKGGNTSTLTDNNIGVVAADNTLTVKLAETVNLGSNGSVQTGNTKMDNTGLTITNGPSMTNNGIDAGNKKITNVADGTSPNDAVNKKQLDEVKTAADSKLTDFNVLANADQVKTVNKDDNSIAFVDGKNIKVTNDGGKVKISTADEVTFDSVTMNNSGNVAEGDNKAVTGDTVSKAIESAVNGLSKTVVAAGNNVTVGEPATSEDGKTVTYTVNAEKTTVSAKQNGGLTATAGEKSDSGVTNYEIELADTTKNDIQAGKEAKAEVDKGFKIQADADTTADKKLGDTVAVKGDGKNISTELSNGNVVVKLNSDLTDLNSITTTGGVKIANDGIDAGNKTITNVADGTQNSDAVNKGQLDKAVQEVAGTVKTSSVKAGNNTTVTSVANGNNTEYTVNAEKTTVSAKQNGGLAVEAGDTSAAGVTDYAISLAKETQDKIDNAAIDIAKGFNLQADGETTANKALGDTIAVKGDGKNISTTLTDGNVVVTLSDSLTGLNSITTTGGVKITNDGINAGNKAIGNVASGGTTATNAANIGDVNKATAAAKTEVKGGTNVAAVTKTEDAADGHAIYTVNADGAAVSGSDMVTVTKGNKDSDNVTDYKVDLAQTTKDEIQKGADAAKEIADKGLTFSGDTEKSAVKKLGDEVAISGDSNITTVANTNGVQVKLNSDLTGLNSITTTGGVVINGDGINAGGNTISHVKAAENGTDAVNKNQLDEMAKSITDNAKTVSVKAGKNTTVTANVAGNNTEYTIDAEKTTVTATADSGLSAVAKPDVATGITDYAVSLSQASKASLEKADSALQSWTAQVNGAEAKVVSQDNNSVNFVNGDNIEITTENGAIKVATAKTATFDNVTINNGGKVEEGSKTAVNGGDVYTAIQNSEAQFKGDNADVTVKRNPNQVLSITGGATGETTANNLKTIGNADGSIAIQLAKNLTDLTSVATQSINVGETVKINKDGINAGNTTISDVKAGENDTDAVNKQQLDQATAAAKTDVKAGTNIATVETTVGDNGQTVYTVNAEGATVSAASESLTVTSSKEAATNVTDYKVDLAQTTKADIQKGADAKAAVDSKGLTFTADGTEKSAVKKLGDEVAISGDDNITTTANTDGVKIALNKNVDLGTDGSIKAGGVTIDNNGINAGNKVIANVADGNLSADSKEAVNGSQLFATNNNVTNNATNIAKNAADIVTNAGNITNLQSQTWKLQANGDEASAVAASDTVQFENGSNITISRNGNDITIATGSTPTFDSATITNGGNIAADSTSAVNGGDVYNAIQGSEQQFTADNGETVIKRKPTDVLTLKGGATESTANNIQTIADTDGSIAIQLAKNVDLGTDGSLKVGDTGVNNAGVTIKSPTTTNAENTVSLSKDGLNNGGNKIANVADGVDGTDAVNKSQLDKAVENITGSAKTVSVKAGNNTSVTSVIDGNNTEYTVNAEKTTVSTAEDSGLVATPTADTAKNVTDYAIGFSQATKDTLAKADTALQSWTANVNGNKAKDVDQNNNVINFVNGDNIEISAEGNGDIKVSTAKNATFDTVTVNNGGTVADGSKTAVNGGDVYTAIQNTNAQFKGDNDTVITRKPSEILNIKGGATGDTAANNIKTTANADGSIAVELAKNLNGLGTVSADSLKVGDTVEISKDGIDAGNKVISNIADGVDGKDAVNKGQLDALKNEIAASEKS
ncbi:hypothetical protein OA57_11140, partial [Chelonobacter oris]